MPETAGRHYRKRRRDRSGNFFGFSRRFGSEAADLPARAGRALLSFGTQTGWQVAVVALTLAFIAIFFCYPVLKLAWLGFVTHGHFNLDGVSETFGSLRTWRILKQTIYQGFWGTIGSVVLGIPGAYVFYRCSFPGQRLARALIGVPFVLPSVVVGAAFRQLLGPGGWLESIHLVKDGVGGFGAVVLACVFFNYSVVVRTVGVVWESLDGRREEVARTLGARPLRVFTTITLPALSPAIAAASAIVFLYCATAYGIMQILAGPSYGTIETEIWYQTTQLLNLPVAAVISFTQIILALVCLSLSAWFTRRQEHAASMTVKKPHKWSKKDLPALIITLTVSVGILGLPLANLLTRSFYTSSKQLTIANYYNLFVPPAKTALVSVSVSRALLNSLAVAIATTIFTLIIGVALALVLGQSTNRFNKGKQLLEILTVIPLGVSAVTVGFGFLITLDKPPLDLRSSFALVPLAQTMVAIPLVAKMLVPTLRAVDPRLREVAASLGASSARVAWTLDWAYLRRALGSAAGIVAAISLGEFGATSFIARPESATLPVVIYRILGSPGVENDGMALAACVVLAVATATLMLLGDLLNPQPNRHGVLQSNERDVTRSSWHGTQQPGQPSTPRPIAPQPNTPGPSQLGTMQPIALQPGTPQTNQHSTSQPSQRNAPQANANN